MTSKEARKVLQEVWRNERTDYQSVEFREALDRAIRSLGDRPQGEWVTDNWGMFHCNYCMREKQQLFHNFCSYCGADMRGEKE